jgi:hypothetical protein
MSADLNGDHRLPEPHHRFAIKTMARGAGLRARGGEWSAIDYDVDAFTRTATNSLILTRELLSSGPPSPERLILLATQETRWRPVARAPRAPGGVDPTAPPADETIALWLKALD